ncbi:2'-5' RNA ligase family protein [Hydrogenophaga sp.]|uniref:2'-5' RNA ligase family protein n=1 Tax=Hydrogenophaga sp. TaxID=1904254 RepID=UPI00271A9741|nr:2'-5' RNA ligase family protein [Hydrogenophaga sp.]MDO8905347.1 2'-5' RNA ligase family protein [Hydrogenophaga sp.]
MPTTAFAVLVPSAESLVAELRERFDPTVKLGVPPHISILVPFMDPAHVTPAVLAKAQEALMEVPSFEFTLRRVGRFPTTTYLAPAPSAPFVAMTAALVRVFPEFPPYGGEHAEVIPHLTVADGDAERASLAALELEEKLRAAGQIKATACTSVVLLENSTGRWKEMNLFKLGEAP